MEQDQPFTWDENGRLVPLDGPQLNRQLSIAKEASRSNPPLPDNRILSNRESLNRIWLDVARMIDSMFGSRESVPLIVAAQPPFLLFLAVGFLIKGIWPLLIGIVLLVGGFRLWVWYRIERR